MAKPVLTQQAHRATTELQNSSASPLLKELGTRTIEGALASTNGTTDKTQAIAENQFASTTLLTGLISAMPKMISDALAQHVGTCPWKPVPPASQDGQTKALAVVQAWSTSLRPIIWPVTIIVVSAIMKDQLSVLLDALL